MTHWREATLDRDGWCCQGPTRGLTGECSGRLEAHHMFPRGRGGKNDLDGLITLCSHHHRWVESHRAEAYELGLLRRTPPSGIWQTCSTPDRDEVCDTPTIASRDADLIAAGWAFERQPFDTTHQWYCPQHRQGTAA